MPLVLLLLILMQIHAADCRVVRWAMFLTTGASIFVTLVPAIVIVLLRQHCFGKRPASEAWIEFHRVTPVLTMTLLLFLLVLLWTLFQSLQASSDCLDLLAMDCSAGSRLISKRYCYHHLPLLNVLR